MSALKPVIFTPTFQRQVLPKLQAEPEHLHPGKKRFKQQRLPSRAAAAAGFMIASLAIAGCRGAVNEGDARS
jgi:hypothetical protein